MASRNVSNIFIVRSVQTHDGCHFEGNAACDCTVLCFSDIECFREHSEANAHICTYRQDLRICVKVK